MATRIVIDGNAFYEIDEDCMQMQREQQGGQLRQSERQSGQTQQSERQRNGKTR